MPPIMEEDEVERKASNVSNNGNNKENRKSKVSPEVFDSNYDYFLLIKMPSLSFSLLYINK